MQIAVDKFLRPPPVTPVVGLPQRRQGSARKGDGPPCTDASIADPGTLARAAMGDVIVAMDELCRVLARHPQAVTARGLSIFRGGIEDRLHQAMAAREFPHVVGSRLDEVA